MKDGPFSDCGLNSPTWLSIDPKNPNHIYMIENKSSIRLIDMEVQELTTVNLRIGYISKSVRSYSSLITNRS